MSAVVRTLGRVLRDRLHELDAEIIRSQSEREVAWLWKLRTGVRKLYRAPLGTSKRSDAGQVLKRLPG